MIDYKNYFEKGISYQKYLEDLALELKRNSDHPNAKYIPLNSQRTKRLDKTFKLSENFVFPEKPIKWLVLSEHWCGDSSQIMPVLNKIAEGSNGKIELRILYRDENPELMAKHLTNGSLSIPKLIQLDEHFNLLLDWGPRPKLAQELVIKLKSDPVTALTYSEELHKWYAQDKQKEILKELSLLISQVSPD